MTCRPDGVDAAARESTHRVREPRQSRDGIDPRRLVESYGAQPPVELLRQFLDFKGFYDRDKLFWKDITDTMLFTGAAPPGGGRSVVTPRFTRHYNVFCVPPASEAVMRVIFESIFSGFMKPFDKDVQRLVGALAASCCVHVTRGHRTMPGVVCFVILSCFGPRRGVSERPLS